MGSFVCLSVSQYRSGKGKRANRLNRTLFSSENRKGAHFFEREDHMAQHVCPGWLGYLLISPYGIKTQPSPNVLSISNLKFL
jgi:hypothetical protein